MYLLPGTYAVLSVVLPHGDPLVRTLQSSFDLRIMLTNIVFQSSNDTIGKTYTTLYEEEAICCEMGPKGLCLCTSLIPLNCITIPGCGVTPLPSCIAYCCLSMWLRRKFVMKYNVDESLACGTMLFYASFFPCSLYQVLRTARHFDVEREQPVPLPTTKPGRDPLPSKYAELV